MDRETDQQEKKAAAFESVPKRRIGRRHRLKISCRRKANQGPGAMLGGQANSFSVKSMTYEITVNAASEQEYLHPKYASPQYWLMY
jgi:hypothetical protein